jgi:hypothetical protein
VSVSDRDRDYMRRLGEWEAENAAEDLRAHLALSIEERLRRSWEMTVRYRDWVRPEEDDFAERFFARAKELGLYRG